MAINVVQFARTTLSAPLRATDTVMQLAQSGGIKVNIPVADYGFLTLYDGQNVEVVRYNGVVPATDNITVVRAQDGTSVHEFPAGTCVAVTLNLKSVLDYVRANLNNPNA
jgi:hypothetical protein